jgi:hypothetical protein
LAGEITATDVAELLQIDPTTFQRWLRRLVDLGHPIVRQHRPWDRWLFESAEANALTQLYTEEHGRRARGPLVSIRLRGSDLLDLEFSELNSFLSALSVVFESAWEMDQLEGAPRQPLTLGHISAGSPFDLTLLLPAIPAAIKISAAAVAAVVVAINHALDGRTNRARTRAETAAIRDKAASEVDRTNAEIRAIEQKARNEAEKNAPEIREIDARIARENRLASLLESEFRAVEVVDPSGILTEFGQDSSGRMPRTARLIDAEATIASSPVRVDTITISYARPKRRRARRR